MEGLLRISDYHRREQLQALKLARQVMEEASPQFGPSSVPEGDEEGFDEEGSAEEGSTHRLSIDNKAGARARALQESPSSAFWDLPKVTHCFRESDSFQSDQCPYFRLSACFGL